MENQEATGAALDGAFKAELERRLLELDGCADGAFGRFTLLDWIASAVLFVLIPLLFVWLFR